MSLGLNDGVLLRLWNMLNLLQAGETKMSAAEKLGVAPRVFVADVARLKKIGVPLRYRRSSDSYEVDWPKGEKILRLNSEELFYCFYTLALIEKSNSNLLGLKNRLLTVVLPDASPIHDCGPSYGISQNVNGLGSEVLILLGEAIQSCRKVVFQYEKPNGGVELREVHPYKLFHSPISWYLSAWCVDKKDFRLFKLSRMSIPRKLKDSFNRTEYSIEKILGDAWWVQHDPSRLTNPYVVKILFKNEAARTIREYKFHKTQTYELHEKGAIVTWQLSYLNEFASWLMQWLGQIEIIACEELKAIIAEKLKPDF